MRFLSNLLAAMLAIVLLIIGAIVITGNNQCEHEDTRMLFVFHTEDGKSYKRPCCKECYEQLKRTEFRGTPEDTSYLSLIQEHSNSTEMVGGEYYTVTAKVSLEDYEPRKTRIRCRLENEEVIVVFLVDFRDEFEEAVGVIEEGDEITFRGRFYNQGCGFTDCELVVSEVG